jgi:hypothetical protein
MLYNKPPEFLKHSFPKISQAFLFIYRRAFSSPPSCWPLSLWVGASASSAALSSNISSSLESFSSPSSPGTSGKSLLGKPTLGFGSFQILFRIPYLGNNLSLFAIGETQLATYWKLSQTLTLTMYRYFIVLRLHIVCLFVYYIKFIRRV